MSNLRFPNSSGRYMYFWITKEPERIEKWVVDYFIRKDFFRIGSDDGLLDCAAGA
jgi:hypothetical protein